MYLQQTFNSSVSKSAKHNASDPCSKYGSFYGQTALVQKPLTSMKEIELESQLLDQPYQIIKQSTMDP